MFVAAVKIGHELEREQRVIYVRIWKEEREGKMI